jgi:hypothetical protein
VTASCATAADATEADSATCAAGSCEFTRFVNATNATCADQRLCAAVEMAVDGNGKALAAENEAACVAVRSFGAPCVYTATALDARCGELRCLPGSTGALCGACDRGFTLSALDNECTPCQQMSVDNLMIITLLGVTIFGILAVKFCIYPCIKKGRVQMDKMEDAGFITKVKIIVSLSQVISEMPFSLALSYPEMFMMLLKWLGVFRIDFISLFKLDCPGRPGAVKRH